MTNAELADEIERALRSADLRDAGYAESRIFIKASLVEQIIAALRHSSDKVLVPREPTQELLVSMALRANHGFGLDDERSKEIQISDMRKVHEEVVGAGFYREDRKDYYRAMLPAEAEGHHE